MESMTKGISASEDRRHNISGTTAGSREPAGWKLVPVEPTDEMLAHGLGAYAAAPTHVAERLVLIAYRAMLNAAPVLAGSRAAEADQSEPTKQEMAERRIRVLLQEARATLEMWKDVAPAVSLCADIDDALAPPLRVEGSASEAPSPDAVRIYVYQAASHHTLPALQAALSRAAFLLRREGNGAYDAEQAGVIESLLLRGPA